MIGTVFWFLFSKLASSIALAGSSIMCVHLTTCCNTMRWAHNFVGSACVLRRSLLGARFPYFRTSFLSTFYFPLSSFFQSVLKSSEGKCGNKLVAASYHGIVLLIGLCGVFFWRDWSIWHNWLATRVSVWLLSSSIDKINAVYHLTVKVYDAILKPDRWKMFLHSFWSVYL